MFVFAHRYRYGRVASDSDRDTGQSCVLFVIHRSSCVIQRGADDNNMYNKDLPNHVRLVFGGIASLSVQVSHR